MNTEFANTINTRTNGRVHITVYAAGSLLGSPGMYQGVKNGIADMGNDLTSYNAGVFPFSSITELPSKAQSGWAVSNAMFDFLTKFQPKEWNDVHLLTVCATGAEVLGVSMVKTPILKLEDWKGKTVRGNQVEIINALGGTVKDVPMADIYDALSKGVVDGNIGSSESLKAWKLAEVCKYVTVNSAPVQPSTIWFNVMNKSKWNSLPADIQGIITDTSKEYSAKLGLTWDNANIEAFVYAKSLNDTINILSPDEVQRWTQAITPIVNAHLSALTSKGFTQQEVQDAWQYFTSREDYWNGQQANNNVSSLIDRLIESIK